MREQHGPDHERHEMWTAIADWLDRAAYLWDYGDVGGEHMRHALVVADAYLGAPQTPSSPPGVGLGLTVGAVGGLGKNHGGAHHMQT